MDSYNYDGVFYIKFLKVNSNLIPVKGEEYMLMPIDEEIDNGIIIKTTPNRPEFSFMLDSLESNSDLTPIYSLLPKTVRNDLEGITTINDVLNLPTKDSYYRVHNSTNYTRLSFEVPIRVKQIKSIDGYKTNNIFYETYFYIYYYKGNNNTITNRYMNIDCLNNYLGVGQSKDIPTYTKLSDISKFINNENNEACMNLSDQGQIITDEDLCTEHVVYGSATFRLIPYFINREGTVHFKITNTVNGMAKYNASKDNNLRYKIEVTNTGDVSSGNNVIVTYVPKGVIVNEKSISDNGVYNKKDHTITWNREHILANEKVEVSYKGTANKTANKELIGNSTIKSDQVPEAVQSTNTTVTLDRIIEIISNPETGTMVYIANTNIGLPLSVVITISILIPIITLLIVKKYNSIKKGVS